MSNDPVHNPSHYNAGDGIKCIDAMRSAFHPSEVAAFCKLNAFKYLWRAGKKGDTIEDMEKAQVYLGWAISSTREDEPVAETCNTSEPASVGCANEQNLAITNPAVDRINKRLGELGSRIVSSGTKLTRIE